MTNERSVIARQRLEQIIANGRVSAGRVIEHVEKNQPTDFVVPAARMHVTAQNSGRYALAFGEGAGHSAYSLAQSFHRHALGQAAAKVGMPMQFLDGLTTRGDWGRELVAHNMNQLLKNDGGRYLLRSVAGDVRGFLSDKYRRLDSRPIIEAFAKACAAADALPVEGTVTDTRISIKAILPRVIDLGGGEMVVLGAILENSDFGNGALTMSATAIRLVCINGLIREQSVRQVHLGKRLDDNVEFSRKTYELDTRATASAIGDLTHLQLGPARVDVLTAQMKAAAEQRVEAKDVVATLRKSLTKADAKLVVDTFTSPEVEMLPPGQSAWRLSNALSWVANQTEDADRKLELQKLAGAVLPEVAQEA